jgi:hypothetical protein
MIGIVGKKTVYRDTDRSHSRIHQPYRLQHCAAA